MGMVVATVDDVHQSENAIEIVGQAVPFDPGLYNLAVDVL